MIRQISLYDITPICELLVDLRKESPEYYFVDEDWSYVPDKLYAMICAPNFCGVIDEDYRGFMLGFCHRHWYSKHQDAYEELLFVGQEYRGGALALKLIKAFEARAKNMGAVHVYAGATTGINEERTIKLYERVGYTRLTTPVRKAL